MRKTLFLRSLGPLQIFAFCVVLAAAGDLQAQGRRHTLNSNSSSSGNSSNNNHNGNVNTRSNVNRSSGNSKDSHNSNSNVNHGNSGTLNNNNNGAVAGANDNNQNRRGLGPGNMPPLMWGQMQNMSPEQRRAMFEQMRQQRMGPPPQQPASSASSTPGDQAAIARVYAQQESRDLNDSTHLVWRKLTDEQRKTVAAMSEKKRPAFKKMLRDYIQSPDECSSDTIEKMEEFLTTKQVDSIRKLDKDQRQQAVRVIEGFTSAALVQKFFLDLPKEDKDALKRLTPSEKREYLEKRGLTLPHEVLVSLGAIMDQKNDKGGSNIGVSDMPVSSGSEISKTMSRDFDQLKDHQPALDMDGLIDSWLDDSSSKPISSQNASTTATL